ncbi:MAG: hypothetical protein ACYC4U_26405 [Pirellulaceae bacterium]
MTANFCRSKIEDVVARLQKSKIECEKIDFDSGCVSGDEWANGTATYSELRALAQMDEQRTSEPSCDPVVESDGECYPSAYSAAEQLFYLISPADDGDRDAASDFWLAFYDCSEFSPSTAWLNGFIDGALSKFKAVRDKL